MIAAFRGDYGSDIRDSGVELLDHSGINYLGNLSVKAKFALVCAYVN
jgi:hypothetical protein